MSRNAVGLWVVLLFLATVLLGPRWTFAPAAWLAPALGLAIVHRLPLRRGSLLLLLATYPALLIGWRGVAPFPMPIYPIFMLFNALVGLLPYLLDRWLVPESGRSFAWTLVFPCAATAFEFLLTGNGPLGSFGASAYSQYELAPLMQMTAWTGMWGISFLTSWFGSVLYWAIRQHEDDRPYARPVAGFALALLLILGLGAMRLAAAPSAESIGQNVTVVGVTTAHTEMGEMMGLLREDRDAFVEQTRARHADYLDATRVAAGESAQLLLWPELAGLGLLADVEALVEAGRALADELDVYLAMPVFIANPVEGERSVNKIYLADPDGQILIEHVKYGGNLIEGTEPGPEQVEVVDTPIGRIAAVICWDTDYPAVLRQAGQAGADLLLSPAYIWPAAAELHAEMAAFRAIENGLTIFRHSDDGLSQIIDPYGRVVASQNLVGADEALFLAEAPVGSVPTRYPNWGDWVGLASLLGMALALLLAFRRRIAKKVSDADAEV